MWKQMPSFKLVSGEKLRPDFSELEAGDIIQLSSDPAKEVVYFFLDFKWQSEPADMWKHTMTRNGGFSVSRPFPAIVTDKIVKIHTDTMMCSGTKEVVEYLSYYYVINVTVSQGVELQINSSALLDGLVIHKWE